MNCFLYLIQDGIIFLFFFLSQNLNLLVRRVFVCDTQPPLTKNEPL